VKRREFCLQACQAASVAALGAIVPGCGSGSNPTGASGNVPQLSTLNGSSGAGGVTVTIDAAGPLGSAGGAALVQSSVGNFLVSRSAGDTFVALTAVCTHEQCTVTGFQSSLYVCPCHGSEYSTSGAVVMGPATRALQQFATRYAAPTLTISA
jgi:cytochrome b6-f complex iron-sulfur subunit